MIISCMLVPLPCIFLNVFIQNNKNRTCIHLSLTKWENEKKSNYSYSVNYEGLTLIHKILICTFFGSSGMEEWWMEENGSRLEVIKSLLLRVLDSQPSNHPHLDLRQTIDGWEQVLSSAAQIFLWPYSVRHQAEYFSSLQVYLSATWGSSLNDRSPNVRFVQTLQNTVPSFTIRNAASTSTVPPTRKHLASAHTHSHTHAIRNEIRKCIYKKTNRRRKGKKKNNSTLSKKS